MATGLDVDGPLTGLCLWSGSLFNLRGGGHCQGYGPGGTLRALVTAVTRQTFYPSDWPPPDPQPLYLTLGSVFSGGFFSPFPASPLMLTAPPCAFVGGAVLTVQVPQVEGGRSMFRPT